MKTGFHHVSVDQTIVFEVPKEVDLDLYRERGFAIYCD